MMHSEYRKALFYTLFAMKKILIPIITLHKTRQDLTKQEPIKRREDK